MIQQATGGMRRTVQARIQPPSSEVSGATAVSIIALPATPGRELAGHALAWYAAPSPIVQPAHMLIQARPPYALALLYAAVHTQCSSK